MFCKNCGNQLEEGIHFCSKCGSSTESNMISKKSPNPSKVKKVGFIVAACAAVMLFIFSTVFIIKSLDRNRDNVSSTSDADGNDGTQTQEPPLMEEEQEIYAGCNSYTIGETTAASQWISDNWDVDSILDCDFLECFSAFYGMTLMVKRPGINCDYALFGLHDGDSNVSDIGVFGSYIFLTQMSGIYCGTSLDGFDVYKMYNSTFPVERYCAINKIGKIEWIMDAGDFLFAASVSYGEDGKQERVECGLIPNDAESIFQSSQEFEQFTFGLKSSEVILEYKYDSITNQITEVQAVEGDIEGNLEFHYLNSEGILSLDSITCRLMDGENERSAWINYSRDSSGNLISFEIGEEESQ